MTSALDHATETRSTLRLWKLALVAGVLSLLVLFGFGLRRDPDFMPSALVGRKLPEFTLPYIDGQSQLTSAGLIGKPTIVNFWASWCGACRDEHGVLLELGRRYGAEGNVRLLGINYRDTRENAGRFLERMGAFPYASVADQDARTGMDFGVFGLPETFFVDRTGIVRARHIGPLSIEAAEKYLAIIEAVP